jgi:hypothetical protein
VRVLVEDLKAGDPKVSTADMTVIQPHQIAPAPDPFDSRELPSFDLPLKVEEGSNDSGADFRNLLRFSLPPKLEEGSSGEQALEGLTVSQLPSLEGQA